MEIGLDLGFALDEGELVQRAVRQDALEQIHLDAVDAAHVAEVVDGLPDAELQKAQGLPHEPGLHHFLPWQQNNEQLLLGNSIGRRRMNQGHG